MRLQPIVYVTDMDRSVAWYRTLLGADPSVASDHWTSFDVGGGHLALHWTEAPLGEGGVALSLVADDSLESLLDRVTVVRPIAEEPFGRSLVVQDPDGNLIQVNEH